MQHIENINQMVYNIIQRYYVLKAVEVIRKGEVMSTSNLIKKLCKEKGISVAELARRVGQTPQNFSKKLKRETVSTEELMLIANVLGVVFEQSYILENGEKLTITSESK